MKVTIEIDTEKDGLEAVEIYTKAPELAIVLSEIDNRLRDVIKYNAEGLPDSAIEIYENVRQDLIELKALYGVGNI